MEIYFGEITFGILLYTLIHVWHSKIIASLISSDLPTGELNRHNFMYLVGLLSSYNENLSLLVAN